MGQARSSLSLVLATDSDPTLAVHVIVKTVRAMITVCCYIYLFRHNFSLDKHVLRPRGVRHGVPRGPCAASPRGDPRGGLCLASLRGPDWLQQPTYFVALRQGSRSRLIRTKGNLMNQLFFIFLFFP